jgi:hypothetical protein
MYDKSRNKKASGEMPRPEMGGATAATEMPTGEMNSGGYVDAAGGLQAAPSIGTSSSPSLYDEMFGLHEIRRSSTESGTMPEAPASESAPSGGTGEGPMPGAAIGGEAAATGQTTIEITGRWRLTLTPAP